MTRLHHHPSVFNADGRIGLIWVGTNDSGATNADPTGGGAGIAAGNNMKAIGSYEYDNGNAGGDGLLTEERMPVDDTSGNDRIILRTYDSRDRLETTTVNDGTKDYITKSIYDNLDRITAVETYHTGVAAGNLTSKTEFFYDSLGRRYKTAVYEVDPATGAVGNALVSEMWRDGSGNVIKATGTGSEAFSKSVYDGLNRSTTSYLAVNSGTSTNTNDVSGDVVIEQTATTYDSNSNVILSSSAQRFDDATGNGALNGPNGAQPKARVTYGGAWYDGIGRNLASANVGTNGGATWTRPDTVPTRSDTVLVTSSKFKSDGEANATIDPMGVETHWDNDHAGRRIRLIENVDATANADDYGANRTMEYVYAADGGLECLILVNPVTGNQVTRWVYGTTLNDSDIARSDLLRAKIYPMSDDEARKNRDKHLKRTLLRMLLH